MGNYVMNNSKELKNEVFEEITSKINEKNYKSKLLKKRD